MIFAVFALAGATMAPPEEQLAGQIRAAIWNDLQMNAMIGNGNWLAAKWYLAGSDLPDPPTLQITELACRSTKLGYDCAFDLVRLGGPAMYAGETAPYKLGCMAPFLRINDGNGLQIKHFPPSQKNRHSRTAMRCKSQPAGTATELTPRLSSHG